MVSSVTFAAGIMEIVVLASYLADLDSSQLVFHRYYRPSAPPEQQVTPLSDEHREMFSQLSFNLVSSVPPDLSSSPPFEIVDGDCTTAATTFTMADCRLRFPATCWNLDLPHGKRCHMNS